MTPDQAGDPIECILRAGLPAPEPEAWQHSLALQARLHEEIAAAGGALPFARFMELALYAPGLGYYSAGARKFGEAGDFVTAPELSPLFSRCLARQAFQILDELGGGDLLEFGAGSGRMAADILLELERLQALPEHYFILEVSPDLRQRQHQTLAERAPQLLGRVQWLERLPERLRGVVLANEVLDAMPVHMIRYREEGVGELYVTSHGDRFEWQEGELSSEALALAVHGLEQELGAATFCPGYTTEINLYIEGWLGAIAGVLEEGLVLMLDYGFPRHEYYHPERTVGTLMCHYRHRAHSDPLILAGLQDITAHVDFTAVAEAGHRHGLEVAGYTAQGQFLLGCGLGEMAAEAPDEPRAQLELNQQIKKLTLPNEMGELFKVLALTRGEGEPLRGFLFQDRRGRL